MRYRSTVGMSEEEYAKYRRQLERRIFFWGMMEALHPLPLVLLIVLLYIVGAYLGWCKP